MKIPSKYKNIAKLNQKLAELDKLCSQYLALKNYDKALEYALQAHKMVPAHTVPLDRAASICIYAKRYADAVKWANKVIQRDPNYLNAYNALSHGYFELREYEKCQIAGLKALNLTEATLGKIPTPELPPLSLKENGKNIIAFSLFGDKPLYLENAVLNAELVNEIYPGWVCRFYVDNTVPLSIIERLKNNGAEIVDMSAENPLIPKTIWRFLAADDPHANYILFRDADSIISQQEAKIVAQWQASGQRFHTIRDHGSHTELILAGLWGMIGGSIPDMRGKIMHFIESEHLDKRFADQHFLRKAIWQYVRQDVYASDSIFGFGENVHPFENPFRNNALDEFHIGQPEFGILTMRNEDFQKGDTIIWQLYTKISPKLNDDLSFNVLPEERFICEYEVIAEKGVAIDNAPRRYVRGVSDNLTRVVVKKKS